MHTCPKQKFRQPPIFQPNQLSHAKAKTLQRNLSSQLTAPHRKPISLRNLNTTTTIQTSSELSSSQTLPSVRPWRPWLMDWIVMKSSSWPFWAMEVCSPLTVVATWWRAWLLISSSYPTKQQSPFQSMMSRLRRRKTWAWTSTILTMCLPTTLPEEQRDPAFRPHLALQWADFNRLCVPLKLHSDGVAFSRRTRLGWKFQPKLASLQKNRLAWKPDFFPVPSGSGFIKSEFWKICKLGFHPPRWENNYKHR